MGKLLKYMRGYGKECILAPLFKLLEATFELFVPLVVANIVDTGIAAGDNGYAVRMSALMALLGAVGLACAVSAQYFSAKAAVGFASRLRHAVMAHILHFGYDEIDRVGTSTLVTRMTSDINQVQNGVNLTLRLLLRSPFVVFGAMVMAFTIHARTALIFLGVIAVLCVVVFGIMLITMPMYTRVQRRLDAVTSATRQNLTGVRVLRAFCMEDEQVRAFREKTQSLTKGQLIAGRISALMNPVTLVIVNLGVIVLIHVGAIEVNNGVLSQGLVIALYNYMSQILVELVKMANLIISMTKAAACAHRVQSLLEIEPEHAGGTHRDSAAASVEFRDVTAHYRGAGAPSLEHITFSAQAGQTVGIIGGTGAGKTTLVELIPRFYAAAGGEVLVNGTDVAQWDTDALRAKIGIVPQKAALFQGTVRENLLWGNPDATDDMLWDALKTAQAEDVVRAKENGLDARVEQGGTNFSGGQRQRLTIARALVKKPDILILDDSASALDYATDARLRTAIRSMEHPPTTFLVSQRAASVRYADVIVVLDDGVVAGCGTHEQLLAACKAYQEIYYSQFPKEADEDGAN